MDLPHRAFSVYIYLADRANKDGICWPSIPTISKDLKLSESTTRRAIGDLRKAGLVQTEQRYSHIRKPAPDKSAHTHPFVCA